MGRKPKEEKPEFYKVRSFVEKDLDPPLPVSVSWLDSVMQTDLASPGWMWPQQYEGLVRENMFHITVGFLTKITYDGGVVVAQSIRPDRKDYNANLIKIPAVSVLSIHSSL